MGDKARQRKRGFRAARKAVGGVRGRRRMVVVVGAVLGFAVLSGGVLAATHAFSDTNVWPYAQQDRSPVLAVVGDISCQPGSAVETESSKDLCTSTRNQAQAATANQIENMKPDLVALLGDMQYQVGRYEDFLGSFDKTYGAFKFLQRPAPGNHEFYDRSKSPGVGETGVKGYGYFDYYNGSELNADGTQKTVTFASNFGGAPFTQPQPRQDGQAGHFGATGDGWYSYNLGSWHIISLNEECAVEPGGCDPNGAWLTRETQWLAQDLSVNHSACTIAYWHHPTFSVADATSTPAGATPEGLAAQSWWRLLYQHGADLVLNGHDHTYARYAPMDPTGQPDPKKGIREFIVGTGGESLDPPVANANSANLEAASGDYYGVMALTLNHNSYSWDFESSLKSPTASGPATYSDTGSGKCHGPVNGD